MCILSQTKRIWCTAAAALSLIQSAEQSSLLTAFSTAAVYSFIQPLLTRATCAPP